MFWKGFKRCRRCRLRGRGTPQQDLDDLATAQDQALSKLQASGSMKRCEPRIAEPRNPETWLARPGAPKPKLDDGEGQGRTADYDTLIRSWCGGKPEKLLYNLKPA